MSDKEILFQAANTFTKNVVKNLFGISSIGTDALITYVVNNAYDKNGYINIEVLGNALKDVIKAKGGYTISVFGKHIKFTDADITEFVDIFNTLKANNG